MAYATWSLLDDFEALRREMERAFDGSGFPGLWPVSRVSFLPGRAARVYPLLNVSEDKDNVYVEALAPGVDPKSLEITVEQHTLRLAGEKQALTEEIEPEAFHRNERSAGKFVRTITLPTEIDEHNVAAKYSNGVIRITLPKSDAVKPKQIEVKVN